MAVWFNRPATTFDPAPFELTALKPAAVIAARDWLQSGNLSDAAFNSFDPSNNFAQRESAVTGYYLQGECSLENVSMKINSGQYPVAILKALVRLALIVGSLMSLTACFDTLTWKEEVKLSDGRMIIVTQKRRFDGIFAGDGFDKPPREAWLTFKLPEYNNQEIVWHENLDTRVLNIYEGKLYIVGFPHTEREFRQYGSPHPSYIGYRYDKGHWVRIPFNEIPVAIYDSNMWFNSAPYNGSKYVTLADKEKQMKDNTYNHSLKRIDPAAKGH